jgi:hypothetical protein
MSSPTNGFLWNFGTLNLNTSALKTVENGFNITNQGIINHNNGDLYLNNGQVVMQSGEYNINADNITIGYDGVSSGSHDFFLLGGATLKKSIGSGSGTSTINLPNFSAFAFTHIISEEGTLAFDDFNFNFTSFEGSGSFQLPSGDVVNGDISPGSSPGILTFVGDLTTGSGADFNIEINGPNVGTEYDRIEVTNQAILDGNINVTLGYLPENDASFEILHAVDLVSCNFPSQITVNYFGIDYTFDVICNGKSLLLNGPGATLTNEEFELQEIALFPNPSNSVVTIKMNAAIKGNWQLINPLGQIVKESDFEASELKISVQDLNSSIYFLKITDSEINQSITKRIIVTD